MFRDDNDRRSRLYAVRDDVHKGLDWRVSEVVVVRAGGQGLLILAPD